MSHAQTDTCLISKAIVPINEDEDSWDYNLVQKIRMKRDGDDSLESLWIDSPKGMMFVSVNHQGHLEVTMWNPHHTKVTKKSGRGAAQYTTIKVRNGEVA
jgi:hypothetical protein